MLFDSHIHTELSTDSSMKIEDAIHSAHKLNMGIIITEHMDFEFPYPFPEFRVDLEAFWKRYLCFRNDDVLLGIEVGMTEGSLEQNRMILSSHPFDFVLGSIHVLYGKEVDTELFRMQDETEVFRDYLLMSQKLVSRLDIDSFAHIDYPLRYCQNELRYEDYRPLFDDLFITLCERKICLELNTRRLGCSAETDKNMRTIFEAYRANGGQYVTIGSDAHTPESIGCHFDAARELLRDTKLTPVHFVKRKMIIEG